MSEPSDLAVKLAHVAVPRVSGPNQAGLVWVSGPNGSNFVTPGQAGQQRAIEVERVAEEIQMVLDEELAGAGQ